MQFEFWVFIAGVLEGVAGKSPVERIEGADEDEDVVWQIAILGSSGSGAGTGSAGLMTGLWESLRRPLLPVRSQGLSGSTVGAIYGRTTATAVWMTADYPVTPASATECMVSVWCVQPTKVGWL